jgi:N12 class adenine-specific DNA methylase
MSKGNVSQYFIDHPEMILGEQGMFELTAGLRYGVRPTPGMDIGAALKAAAERLPANIVHAVPTVHVADTAPALDLQSTEKKDGSYYLAGGKLMQYRGGIGREVQGRGKGVSGGMSAAEQERVRLLVPVKDALREVYAADIRDDKVKGEAARKKLNATYDKFVAKHGPINKTEVSYRAPSSVQLESARAEAREEARLAGREWDDGSFEIQPLLDQRASVTEIARQRKAAREAALTAGRQWDEGTFDPEDVPDTIIEKRPNLDPFMEDEESYRLAAIEHYNKETGEAAKGRAFFENAIRLDAKPEIKSAQDGLLYSLNRLGRPDINLIADMAGLSHDAVLEELGHQLFEVPGAPGTYQTAESYLAGDVVDKLATAREAAKRDASLQRNVSALEAAQPAPLTASEVAINLGMPWIEPTTIQQFATEKLGLGSAKVSHLSKLAQWTAAGDSYSNAARVTWGTQRMDAMALLEAGLNRQTPKVYDTMSDGKRVLNVTDTQAAQDKLAAIKQAFREWVHADEARSNKLVDYYNGHYNTMVAPKYDGTYLTTPGIASGWSWRPHQRAVIARIIQAGNTYMAHEVGAGKTSAMIGAGMEMKRLGLANKPMYVVPNHMLGQFTKEFYEQYPLARIRVADEQRFHTSRRKEFIARIAADDLDAIIITHSAFGFIPMSDAYTQGMIRQQIAELEDTIAELGKGSDVRITRRKVEQQKQALEEKLKGLTNRKRDQVFTFEETGIDFLFIDEAHMFRKLNFSTKMGDVKGIDPNGSGMAFDLYAKTRYLESEKPGRNLVLASGTPITNTMAELYSVSRYLQEGELKKRGLAHFDAWAGAFGDTVTALEQGATGAYESVTRFAKFVNVPELSVLVRQVMDVVGAAELRQYVSLPTVKGGSRQLVTVDQTPRQEDYRAQLQARMEAIKRRTGKVQKGDDIILSVINDGRKAAIDYRLIDAAAPRENGSKLERLIDEVAQRHKEFARTAFHEPLPDGKGFSAKPVSHGAATQMVFSNFGINGDFQVQKYIRSALVQRGVPANQIAIISDFKSHVAKQRLFNDVNEGKVRVLIGSVAKMGTGVNAQRRLRAVHNMDALWYPADDTQRNGRAIRQGNMNPEVEILDYATNGTYDSTMWAMMARKGRFIEAFFRGDPTLRDMEDLGEASQYEQAAALTTSDPRIMDLTEWKQELEKIERRKLAHEREQQSIRSRINYAHDDVTRSKALVPLIEQDIAKRQLPEGDEFAGKVGGQSYDDRAEFGAALLAAMNGVVERAGGKKASERIGEFGGFPIVAETRPGFGDGPTREFYIERAGDRETRVEPSEDSRGMTQRFVNALRKFDTDLDNARNEIARGERTIADYTPSLGKPFEGGENAAALREKINGLEATLRAEAAQAEAAKNGQQQPSEEPKDSRVAPPANDLPSVTVRAADWGKLPTSNRGRLAILRGRMKRWYRGLLGTTVTSSDGRTVAFGNAGLDKTLRAGEDLMLRARAIPAIIERGKLIGSEPSTQPGIVAVHRYAANVRDESGAETPLVVLVREATDGTFHYSLNRYVEKGASDGPASRPAGLAPQAGQLGALEGAAEDGLNLVALHPDINATDTAEPPQDTARRMEAVRTALAAELEKLGLADKVRLSIVDGLAATGSQGRFMPFSRVIQVALDAQDEHSFVLHHEALHALREMGVFSKTDWKLMADAAKRRADLWSDINRRYRGLSQAEREEEAVADLFALHQRGDLAPQGTIGKLLVRLARFLSAVRNALRGQGFTSTRTFFEVMGEMGDGRAAARAGENPGYNAASLRLPRESVAAEQDDSSPVAKDSRVATADMVDLAGTDPTWRGQMAERYERFRTAMQDRYLPLLKAQRTIERQTGKALPPSLNPYLGEELMSGRIGSRLDKLAENHVEPLFDAMHEDKVTIDELESYLYARHAPERNARIAEINPEIPEGGSGMTDLEAAAVMNRIKKAGKMEAMERLAARVDAIRDATTATYVESGLMSQKQVDEWKDTYEHYVPLRGFAEVGEGDSATVDRINRSGGGLNVRGKESKAAFGRRSKADSPLAYLILQAESAIVRGETNRVAQKFVQLAQQNPDDGFWEVQKVTAKQRINPDTGLVERYLSHNLAAADANWTVSAKFAGKERRVTMNRSNPAARRLADSMRNLTQHQLDWVTLHLGKLNRFLSAVNTSWNPEFVITNAFRDLQTASINAMGIDLPGLERNTLKYYPGALKGATKGAFGKDDATWSKWYDEFVSEGGRVYFNRVEDIGLIKKRIESTFKLAAAKAGQGGPQLQVKRALIAVRDAVENLNLGVENAVRLSTYRAAREAGASKPQAASIAKNITVNFNRRGTFGPAMNALYLFYNAGMQGSVRLLQATRSPKVRKMLAGIAVTGMMVELLNAMLSGTDDDGEKYYDKIPAYEKSRNIILMLPGGSQYLKIPTPYGYNVFWELGRSIGEVGRRGGERWQETGANWLTTALSSFNPIGGADSLLNLIAPTVVDPIVDLELNRDFTGRPIMPNVNPYEPPEPDSQRYWNSVGPHWKAITDFLNTSTGGSQVEPGAVDISPETLEYLMGETIGSAGATLDRIASIPSKAAKGDLDVNDIPIARKLTGTKPSWYDKAEFYDRLGEVEQQIHYAKGYLEQGNRAEAQRFVQDHQRVVSLMPAAKLARNEMRDVRKARRALDSAKEKGLIDAATYRDKKQLVDQAERTVVRQFNTRWNATVYNGG